MYVLADKYAILGLKEKATAKTYSVFCGYEAFTWEDFAQAVSTIWTSTPASQKEIREPYLAKFLSARCIIFEEKPSPIMGLITTSEFLCDAMEADWEIATTGKSTTLNLARRLYCGPCELSDMPKCLRCLSTKVEVFPCDPNVILQERKAN